jgi:hypothetical protein
MIQIAKSLGAKLIGDGETYDIKKNIFGKVTAVQHQGDAEQ